MRKNRFVLLIIAICAFTMILSGCGGTGGDELPPDSIDYVEPKKVVDSFSVGEATINLTRGGFHENVSSEGADNELYAIYFSEEKPEKVGDAMFASCWKGVVNGATEEQQYRDYFESVAAYYKSDAYPGSLATTEEQITRSGRPAYHLVLYSEDDGATYDQYFFMVNANDLIVLSEIHLDTSSDDYSKEYIEFVRNVQTPLDLDVQEKDE